MSAYNSYNLRKALEKAQWAVEEAAQRLNMLQSLQDSLDAAARLQGPLARHCRDLAEVRVHRRRHVRQRARRQ